VVHVGGPQQALAAWSLGATGFLSSEANLAPELCSGLVAACASGDGAALTARFGTLVRLSLAFYGAGGIRATKAVLDRLGLPGGVPRKPQLPVDDAVAERLVRLVEELGITPAG
jgi:4-hydroxy-tetrahydrodipicolinate synthase